MIGHLLAVACFSFGALAAGFYGVDALKHDRMVWFVSFGMIGAICMLAVTFLLFDMPKKAVLPDSSGDPRYAEMIL